jgi:hypothetical protein
MGLELLSVSDWFLLQAGIARELCTRTRTVHNLMYFGSKLETRFWLYILVLSPHWHLSLHICTILLFFSSFSFVLLCFVHFSFPLLSSRLFSSPLFSYPLISSLFFSSLLISSLLFSSRLLSPRLFSSHLFSFLFFSSILFSSLVFVSHLFCFLLFSSFSSDSVTTIHLVFFCTASNPIADICVTTVPFDISLFSSLPAQFLQCTFSFCWNASWNLLFCMWISICLTLPCLLSDLVFSSHICVDFLSTFPYFYFLASFTTI